MTELGELATIQIDGDVRSILGKMLNDKYPTYDELLDGAIDLLLVVRALEEAQKEIIEMGIETKKCHVCGEPLRRVIYNKVVTYECDSCNSAWGDDVLEKYEKNPELKAKDIAQTLEWREKHGRRR